MGSIEELLQGLTPEQQRALLAQLEAGEAAPAGTGPSDAGPAGTASSPPGSIAAVTASELTTTTAASQPSEAPLSFAQQRLWFLHQLQPENPAYHICHRIDWPVALDRRALDDAFGDLATRHAVLRTRFVVVDGEPRQVIDPPGRVRPRHVDLRGLPPQQAVEQRRRIGVDAADAPFDLANGPVFRVTVVRMGEQDYSIFLAQHHIVCDGWSVDLLIDDLAELYRDRRSGRVPAESGGPPGDLGYADFAVWQRSRLSPETLAPQLDYWRHRLTTTADPLELPTDHVRSARGNVLGRTLRCTVPAQIVTALDRLGGDHDTTAFMTLLAALHTLLFRYTGHSAVPVVTPVTNRSHPELERVAGMFLNSLVLQADLTGSPTFTELLEQTRRTVLEAFERQEVPFEWLVEEFGAAGDAGRMPFSPVMFTFNTLADHHDDSGARLTVTEVDTSGARCDLAVVAEDGPDGLRLLYEYDADLFEAGTVERMHAHLMQLLRSAAADPGRRVHELEMLTEAERRQLAGWNQTAVGHPLELTVAQLIDRQAKLTPDGVAVISGTDTLTYRQLVASANRLAHHLIRIGVRDGTTVGVHLHRSCELPVALLGVLKAGATYVPLDPSYPADRLLYMLSDARCPVVIGHGALIENLIAAGSDATFVDVDVDLAGDGPVTTMPDTDPALPTGPDSIAYLLYTSGSTGRPKGVMNTHAGLTNHTLWMRDTFSVTAADVVVQKTPIGFDVSLWELLVPVVSGATLVMAAPDGHMDPRYLAELVRRHRVTMIHFVPSMLQVFLETADLGLCTSLRQVIASGEALPVELQRAFFASGLTARLDNLYGPTEAAIHILHQPCRPDRPPGNAIGRPVANCRAYVLDPHGRPVPVGVTGELYLGGVQVARGYRGRGGLTAAAFLPDPHTDRPGALMYRTGDLARRHADGTIDYLGRRDHQVKLRGFRIELGEIEAALMATEWVSQAVVLLREDAPSGPYLTGYLTLAAEAPDDLSDRLREILARTLPAYMVPQAFVILPVMPLSPNGKADRRALAALAPARSTVEADTTDHLAPRDDVEAGVAALFAELLGRDRVDVRDGFFALGGHSLLATRLAARVHRDFGVDLPLRAVFDAPTVEGLAATVVEQMLAQLDPAQLEVLAAMEASVEPDGDDG